MESADVLLTEGKTAGWGWGSHLLAGALVRRPGTLGGLGGLRGPRPRGRAFGGEGGFRPIPVGLAGDSCGEGERERDVYRDEEPPLLWGGGSKEGGGLRISLPAQPDTLKSLLRLGGSEGGGQGGHDGI